jgi:uncharacterized membrane protein YoaK (UPF0700 family)
MTDAEKQQIRESARTGIGVTSSQKSATQQKYATQQGRRAASLALISGYVDSYALVKFGVYASFMTGNTTSAGMHAGEFNLAAARHSLLPIPMFLLGILAGTLLTQGDRRRGLPRLSALVAAMLTVGVGAAYFAWPASLSIVILSFSMGVMNTSVLQVGGQTVGVGYMTGDLNALAQHIAMGIKSTPVAQAQGSWDTHWRRASLLAGLWIAFLGGAVLGAALGSRLAVWTLLLPALMLLVLALVERDTISDD